MPRVPAEVPVFVDAAVRVPGTVAVFPAEARPVLSAAFVRVVNGFPAIDSGAERCATGRRDVVLAAGALLPAAGAFLPAAGALITVAGALLLVAAVLARGDAFAPPVEVVPRFPAGIAGLATAVLERLVPVGDFDAVVFPGVAGLRGFTTPASGDAFVRPAAADAPPPWAALRIGCRTATGSGPAAFPALFFEGVTASLPVTRADPAARDAAGVPITRADPAVRAAAGVPVTRADPAVRDVPAVTAGVPVARVDPAVRGAGAFVGDVAADRAVPDPAATTPAVRPARTGTPLRVFTGAAVFEPAALLLTALAGGFRTAAPLFDETAVRPAAAFTVVGRAAAGVVLGLTAFAAGLFAAGFAGTGFAGTGVAVERVGFRAAEPVEALVAVAVARLPVPDGVFLRSGPLLSAAGPVEAFLAGGIEVFLLAND
ncbi:hypothetical protein AB0G04_24235 [Actinoplanes sp. NPDC023801]|uniref:hypothetical protein n=1 Tax=Actinoplanes sp. NPDC023801 TaxID=3154595 RepID=UPI0033E079E2